MKKFAKKALKVVLTASALATLSGCGFFGPEKEVYAEAPYNLRYDQENSILYWDASDDIESFTVRFVIYDKRPYVPGKKELEYNWITLRTTEKQIEIPLDPETSDGDKIDIAVFSNKQGYLSNSNFITVEVKGKDKKDYPIAHEKLQTIFQQAIDKTFKNLNLTYYKAIQFDHDYDLKKGYGKVLAKDKEGNLYLVLLEANITYLQTFWKFNDIQDFIEELEDQKGKWVAQAAVRVEPNLLKDWYERAFSSFGDNLIGFIYQQSNSNIDIIWQYATMPYQVDENWWAFDVFSEMDTAYDYDAWNTIEGKVRGDFRFYIKNKEQFKTPQDVIDYLNAGGKYDKKSYLLRKPDRMFINVKHLEYINEHFDPDKPKVEENEEEYNQELSSFTIGNSRYTVVLPNFEREYEMNLNKIKNKEEKEMEI